LFLLPGTSTMLRGQGTYLSDDDITRVVDFVGTDDPQFAGELLQLKTKDELEAAGGGNFQSRDELYETAVDIVVRERRGSVSLLQRALGIGYGRAARLIDFMAEDGVVGQYNGAQARDVLISLEEWEARNRRDTAGEAASAAGTRGTTVAPHSIARTSAGVGDDPARERRPAAIATGRPPRRNKITPADDETDYQYEDESAAKDVDDENWEDETEELDDDSEEESFDEDEELDETESDEDEEFEDEEFEDEEFEDEESEEDDAEDECEEDDSEEEEEWEQEPVTKTAAARSRSK
jgi:S-DNA-T family DNA segregation ATPase FtsK/SpoIIIE